MADRRDRLGLGYLTAALNSAGYDVTGLDISAEAVAKARSRFGPHYQWQDVFEPDESFLGAFDFAILLETIEHVPDPKVFLGAVTRLLTAERLTPRHDPEPRRPPLRCTVAHRPAASALVLVAPNPR